LQLQRYADGGMKKEKNYTNTLKICILPKMEVLAAVEIAFGKLNCNNLQLKQD
jgi:hypothetical protein